MARKKPASASREQTGRPGRLNRLRRITQIVLLGLFLYLLFGTLPDASTFLPADLFFRLNPLAAAAAMLASRALLTSLLLALLVLSLTLLLGRVWCGWVCPLGTTLDLLPWKRRARLPPSLTSRWRYVKYGLLIALVVAAALGNLTLLFLDPIALITRTGATVLVPLLDVMATALEHVAYRIPFLQNAVVWVDNLLRGPILPAEPRFHQLNILAAAIFVAVLLLNGIQHRFWCRHLCPLGALLALISRVSWLRRAVNSNCTSCGKCAGACLTGAIDSTQAYASSPAECIMCSACLEICPVEAIDFRVATPASSQAASPTPGRRQALGSVALSILGVGLLQTLPRADRVSPHLIRPPGGRENNLAAKCIRCGACLKICPTGGLQPAWDQDGLGAIWTPVLVPRLGYCDYSCRACGAICPTGAIPELELDIKRTVVLGQAYIDTHRCIPWADNRDCIVCEEMCPIPDKAIKLDDVKVMLTDASYGIVRRPRVERERCIGCGHCENQCPVTGEAAIRVYMPTAL